MANSDQSAAAIFVMATVLDPNCSEPGSIGFTV